VLRPPLLNFGKGYENEIGELGRKRKGSSEDERREVGNLLQWLEGD